MIYFLFTDYYEPGPTIWDMADRLRNENNYPFEVTPLFISISISARGNMNEARELIKKGDDKNSFTFFLSLTFEFRLKWVFDIWLFWVSLHLWAVFNSKSKCLNADLVFNIMRKKSVIFNLVIFKKIEHSTECLHEWNLILLCTIVVWAKTDDNVLYTSHCHSETQVVFWKV